MILDKPLALPKLDRRGFLAGTATLATLSAAGLLPAPAGAAVDAREVERLQARVKGKVVARDTELYEPWRRSMIWQTQKFPRNPEIIVQAESVEDVVAAVNHARENKRRITTRAGGHSFCGCFMRDDGMLVDVSRLSTIEIDAGKREAIVGPGVIGRRLQEELGRQGLAFPTAHCGMVPVSGFLLGGGLGWNGNAWGGMSVYNILEVEIVTADGQVRTASETENPDLFWAVRGGGPGLFGVVTSFRLRVHTAPKAMRSHTYIFPFTASAEVAAAMEEIGPKLPLNVELIGVITAAPPGMEKACSATGCDQVFILQSVAFVDSEAAALAGMAALKDHPVTKRAIARIENAQESFENLYYGNEVPFPQRRYCVDNIYADSLAKPIEVFIRRMPQSPSRVTAPVLLYKGRPELPDGACATKGNFYVSCYAQWDDPAADKANKDFMVAMYEELQPLGTGSYINELNQEGRIHRIRECYTADGWRKLGALRRKYDPGLVFHTFYGLEPDLPQA
ncbi:FAD linked oxidase domain protein [Rhizorhabdus wittichii RW1]|uniref:FAD linked oxidase domain protein n=1 Tax=Rhizorhabdus wittichii (strain DSM 6014 / CCUG 31198 / JCM 15750 / NBRC 105917 / EY 4224 / RW1) TaxID=392499 RepID=A0A9J9HGB2_RHIWR|nr:FAD linked oxidase domain protein [Rhizorhabdus wittichii RW1]